MALAVEVWAALARPDPTAVVCGATALGLLPGAGQYERCRCCSVFLYGPAERAHPLPPPPPPLQQCILLVAGDTQQSSALHCSTEPTESNATGVQSSVLLREESTPLT
ncbi:hypothetical protein EYF80_037348 [Liparis tanakae]|uniref:Uncharacterized protein n=1 Tax=Liparis tanakae TaxID=230148 RepID=A0A4Z2GFY3_9TELE|nr:hypothetical protein EYF80_037348 [Liparis tanakae]